jgi:hypothetical protein
MAAAAELYPLHDNEAIFATYDGPQYSYVTGCMRRRRLSFFRDHVGLPIYEINARMTSTREIAISLSLKQLFGQTYTTAQPLAHLHCQS